MLKNVTFVKSAMKVNQIPYELKGKHFVLCGRSNVGKSSLINALTNNKKMAKVSQRPGKTTTINFFNVNNKFLLVDLPGYGYVKRSQAELIKFSEAIEEYLEDTSRTKILCQIVDIRVLTKDDIEMWNYMQTKVEKSIIIANKCDKFSNNQKMNAIHKIARELKINPSDIFVVSAQNREGLDKLEGAFYNIA